MPNSDELDGQQIRLIPVEDLEVSEFNVRKRETDVGLDDLSRSLDEYGLHQPIVVAREDGGLTVVIGQRRYMAARQLGWSEIRAVVLPESLERVQATIMSLSENVQRRDLSAKDKSEACVVLRYELGTVRKVAEAIGVSEQTVRNWLGYAAVPDPIKELVEVGGLTATQATRLARNVESEETALEVAKEMAQTPVKANRERLFQAAKDNPDDSLEEIKEKARQNAMERHINFILPGSAALAMDRAEHDQGEEADEIAMTATIQWLEDNDYL